ncbi:hypothetical protein H2C43_04770 [Corynebacterium glutamicum]|nr:hypothetical protein [Corynebacterium glutamicum]ARV64176.1 hypothetical protein B7P23_04320 [Corynebacterium glutamicum]AUI01199.1 hypothetical protein CYL77_08660 [Corynebacterium glutamicum]AUI04849.1 hypothetical protein C0I99_12360 [Corynebacterium glutamicum]MBA4570293.1 hypothetical protein [Corynebacterium glutamicum]MBA4572263.1 hypothetical protein [Corynebacterium glutamicum]
MSKNNAAHPQSVFHIHIPAHTTMHSDRFEHPDNGYGYTIRQDTDAENPMTHHDTKDAALWVHNRPRRGDTVADKPEGNEILDIFAKFICGQHDNDDNPFEVWSDGDSDASLIRTKAYVAEHHPELIFDISAKTITGYSQGDWLDVVCVTTAATCDELIPADSLIDIYRQWAFGDVWTVIPDSQPGLAGIYADDPADALAYYQENFEDEPIWDLLSRHDADKDAAALAAASAAENHALARGTTPVVIRTQDIITNARYLMSDSADDNPEYDRALVELSAYLLSIDLDDRVAAEMTILGRPVPKEG